MEPTWNGGDDGHKVDGSQCHHFKVNYNMNSVPLWLESHSRFTLRVGRWPSVPPSPSPHETTTNGTHMGLVQFRSSKQNQTEFYASLNVVRPMGQLEH